MFVLYLPFDKLFTCYSICCLISYLIYFISYFIGYWILSHYRDFWCTFLYQQQRVTSHGFINFINIPLNCLINMMRTTSSGMCSAQMTLLSCPILCLNKMGLKTSSIGDLTLCQNHLRCGREVVNQGENCNKSVSVIRSAKKFVMYLWIQSLH